MTPLSGGAQRVQQLEETMNWASNTSKNVPPVINPPVSHLPMIVEPLFVEEEFELHLLRLGILYSHLSSNYRLSLVQGQEYAFHQVLLLTGLNPQKFENGFMCKWCVL